MNQARRLGRGLIAWVAPLWAFAQGPQVEGGAALAPSAAVLRQKEQLVSSLLADSSAAERIRVSGGEAARRSFEAAAAALTVAREHLRNSNWGAADSRLNEAMQAIASARRQAPDDALRRAEGHRRYQRLLETIDSLRGAYERHLGRLRGGGGAAAGADDEGLARLSSARERAAARFAAGEVEASLRVLEDAQAELLRGLNRLLGAQTLDYALRFASPAEEFAYENARNRSLAELVPIALAELKPTEGAARLVARYVERNAGLRQDAVSAADRGDLAGALKAMRDGSAYLLRALLSAGLVTPPEAAIDSAETPDN